MFTLWPDKNHFIENFSKQKLEVFFISSNSFILLSMALNSTNPEPQSPGCYYNCEPPYA